jgi:hypothetical protein
VAERLDGIRLTGEETRWAAWLIRVGVTTVESRDGTVPAAALRLRDQLARFARREPADPQASVIAETANSPGGSDPAVSDRQITVTAAAARLGVSEQAVRRWCRSGDLIAWRDAPAGPWIIDEHSADALAASRTAGE